MKKNIINISLDSFILDDLGLVYFTTENVGKAPINNLKLTISGNCNKFISLRK